MQTNSFNDHVANATHTQEYCEGQSGRDLPSEFEHQELRCAMSSEGTMGTEYINYLSQDWKSDGNRPRATLAEGKGTCKKVGNPPNQGKRKRVVEGRKRKKGSSLNTKYLQIT
jgi:hypothetical protein